MWGILLFEGIFYTDSLFYFEKIIAYNAGKPLLVFSILLEI